MTHFTMDEALGFCHNTGIKNMYAAHISPRYDGCSKIAPSFSSDITAVYIMDNTCPNQI
jgi:ribonuclease BN (tRNA processing enzyme)